MRLWNACGRGFGSPNAQAPPHLSAGLSTHRALAKGSAKIIYGVSHKIHNPYYYERV